MSVYGANYPLSLAHTSRLSPKPFCQLLLRLAWVDLRSDPALEHLWLVVAGWLSLVGPRGMRNAPTFLSKVVYTPRALLGIKGYIKRYIPYKTLYTAKIPEDAFCRLPKTHTKACTEMVRANSWDWKFVLKGILRGIYPIRMPD